VQVLQGSEAMSQRPNRWNNRIVLLRWLKQLRRMINDGKILALSKALDVAIEQLERLTQK